MESNNTEERLNRLREQLNEFHDWPSAFTFKFILPACEVREAELKGIFAGAKEVRKRPSAKGNYWAFTITEVLDGPDDVFARYTAASEIRDILSM
jgi:putative lipoic acid-binding regulatory protein